MIIKKWLFFVCVLVLHSTLLEATRFRMFPQMLESLATREFRKAESPSFVRSLRTSSCTSEGKDRGSHLISEKETHMGAHPMPPPFSQKSLNEKISECQLSSYVRSPHFYAYPLGRGGLESIFSDPMSCKSFVRALTQIPSLHTISAVEAPSVTSPPLGRRFYFKGKIEKDTTVYIKLMNRSVTGWYQWSLFPAVHEAQNSLFEFQNQPKETEGQKAFYVYVTLIDFDWEKPFRLNETYDNDPYFASHDFPNERSKRGRNIVYFIPAFNQKKYPSLQDPTYWSHASSQEKWIYFLRHGFMHLDVPLALRDTPFEKVFERLDLKTWNFEKIRDYLDDVLCQRNAFCYQPDTVDKGQVKRKELLSPEYLDLVWPEDYAAWMESTLSAGIDFHDVLLNEDKMKASAPELFFRCASYHQKAFFGAKLDFMIDLASFWHGFYHPEKGYER